MSAKHFDGDIAQNCLKFNTYQIKKMNLLVDGTAVQAHPRLLSSTEVSEPCLDSYFSMLRNRNLKSENVSMFPVDLTSWKTNYYLQSFVMVPNLPEYDSSTNIRLYAPERRSTIFDLALEFETALVEDIKVVIHLTYNRIVSLAPNTNAVTITDL